MLNKKRDVLPNKPNLILTSALFLKKVKNFMLLFCLGHGEVMLPFSSRVDTCLLLLEKLHKVLFSFAKLQQAEKL